MSFNRLTYDDCAYTTTIKESVSSLDYNLFKGKYESCNNCPKGNFKTILPLDTRADVENELFGLTRPNSKCPSKKFDPMAGYVNPNHTPPQMCQSIYHITPNNLVKPTTNLLNENNLALQGCDANQLTYQKVKQFDETIKPTKLYKPVELKNINIYIKGRGHSIVNLELNDNVTLWTAISKILGVNEEDYNKRYYYDKDNNQIDIDDKGKLKIKRELLERIHSIEIS